MTIRGRLLPFLGVAGVCASIVWGARASLHAPQPGAQAPPDLLAGEPAPGALPEAAEPLAVPPAPTPARQTPETLEAQAKAPGPAPAVPVPPVVAPHPDPERLSNEELWSRGSAGTPAIGIPERLEALRELLTRSLTTEERVRTLSQLAFTYRADITASQGKQVEALRALQELAGRESPMGHRASVQMGWPLWEMGRKQEALDTVLAVTTSPRARERDRGMAHWAAMIFALGMDRWELAEEHYRALKATKEPLLASTRTAAGQRMAAARAKRARERERK